MCKRPEEVAPAQRWTRVDVAWMLALAVLVLVSRVAERGDLYFVDGPRIVDSIRAGTYVIQSPGYWAFAHLGGTFQDPVKALAFWNILFSTISVPVFYLLCRERQQNRTLCGAAALAYGFTYFVWFAGEIHSSYASQILFVPLALFCALRWRRQENLLWVIGWSLAASIGFALRPSDGVFLLPLWLYLLPRSGRVVRVWATFFAIQAVGFFAWHVPTQHAMRAARAPDSGSLILLSMRTVSPLFLGLAPRALMNIARVIVPCVTAFGVLLPVLFSRRRREDGWLAFVWVVPGLLFFLLCYMADPHYMICICGGIFWLVVTSSARRRAIVCLLLCAALNSALFLAARPVHSDTIPARLINFCVVKYCAFGLKHHWSSTISDPAGVPTT